jgi:hypothetical protein
MTDREDARNEPDFTEGNPEWAFCRETVEQLTQISSQLTRSNYEVGQSINYNNIDVTKTSGVSLEEYQDAMDGLTIHAKSNHQDYDLFNKRVIIMTNANDDTIAVQAGFECDDKDISLWNNGIYYSKKFSREELGKFSMLWDHIYTSFLSNEVIPITAPVEDSEVSTNKDKYLKGFIKVALETGMIEKKRAKKK